MSRPLLRRVSPLAAALTLTLLAPAAPAARAGPPGEPVRIDSQDDVTVMRATGEVTSVPVATRWGHHMVPSPVYAPICGGGSCTGSLPAGQYTLGASKNGGAVVEADDPVGINGSTTIRPTYKDRGVWRGLGIVTLLATTTGGTVLILSKHVSDTSTVTYPYLGAGVAVLAAGAIASLVMMLQRDSVSFTVSPFSVGAIPGSRESAGVGSVPNGLELTMRF